MVYVRGPKEVTYLGESEMFQFSRMVTLYALTFKCVRVCLCVCLPGMLKNLCLYIVHTCMTLHVLESVEQENK